MKGRPWSVYTRRRCQTQARTGAGQRRECAHGCKDRSLRGHVPAVQLSPRLVEQAWSHSFDAHVGYVQCKYNHVSDQEHAAMGVTTSDADARTKVLRTRSRGYLKSDKSGSGQPYLSASLPSASTRLAKETSMSSRRASLRMLPVTRHVA